VKPQRVLVCDDSALNRKIMAQRLRMEGFEVVEADDGDSAVKLVSDAMGSGDSYDVVCMGECEPDPCVTR
jgi:CheY-like chemotaxis protein